MGLRQLPSTALHSTLYFAVVRQQTSFLSTTLPAHPPPAVLGTFPLTAPECSFFVPLVFRFQPFSRRLSHLEANLSGGLGAPERPPLCTTFVHPAATCRLWRGDIPVLLPCFPENKT